MAKITIDFGCDFVREYSLTRELDQKLRQGEMLKIETMHPRHAEHMVVTSTSNPTKTITIPLELAERIAERLEEVIDPRLDKDLFDELKPLMETQAPEYHHIWEGEYYSSEDKLKPQFTQPNMTATEVNIRQTQAFIDEYNEGSDIGDPNG